MNQATDKGLNQLDYGELTGAVMDRVDRLMDAARSEAVFAEPVTTEGGMVISAAEVMLFTGFGGGGGSGPAQPDADQEATSPSMTSYGIGSGAGGAAFARPVAVIIIDKGGVRVEPIVDVTKLGLAALTALGSMAFFAGRMRRAAK